MSLQWLPCHKCRFRGDEKLCSIGARITDAKSNYFNYGCYLGKSEDRESEVHTDRDSIEQQQVQRT